MKPLALGLLAAILLVLGVTTWISRQSPVVHAALMAQIAQSGLATDQNVTFQPGWLQALSNGRFRLADSFCQGCEVLDYDGRIHHGLGAWLAGDVTLASADYRLSWPQLPIEPPLPPLTVHAEQDFGRGLKPVLRAALHLPASQHEYVTANHRYRVGHAGLRGRIEPGALHLTSDAADLARDGGTWVEARQLRVRAAAADALQVEAQASGLSVPPWQWQANALNIDYVQHGISRNLNFDLEAAVQHGVLGQRPPHGIARATLHVERLNVVATRAFAAELPRLLDNRTPAAARMMGLLSLYSVHGPGFFAPHPALRLQARDLPLPHGSADLDVQLAVTAQTRRPPMHPMEWRRALQGRVDISAPAQQLAAWWHWGSVFINYVTGLPRDYASLRQQGWVTSRDDGRDRLRIVLDPATGPRRE